MTIIEDRKLAENYFRNKLEEIRKEGNGNYIHTSNDVWGKEVRFLNIHNKEEKHMLENWYISLRWDENCDIDTLIKQFGFLAHKKELDEILKFLDNSKLDMKENVIIEELCDWQFLQNEQGEILDKSGVITLVKYAVVVKKEG